MRRTMALPLAAFLLLVACGGDEVQVPSTDRSAGCRDRMAQVAPQLNPNDPVYVDLYDTCMNRPKD